MQKKQLKIFRSFEEQEIYKQSKVIKTTVSERFQNLFYMQMLSAKFNSSQKFQRSIRIKNGFTSS